MEQMVVDNFSEIEINLDIKGDFENDTDTDSSDTEHSGRNDTDTNSGVDQQTDMQETDRTPDEQADGLPEISF